MKYIQLLLSALIVLFSTQLYSQGNCLDFDGVDDLVNVANHSNINFGTNSFTVECWIRTDVKNQPIVSKMDNALTTGWILSLDGNGKMSFNLNGSQGTPANANDLSDNTWHHIAVIRKDILSFYTYLLFYEDGIEVGSSMLFTGGSVSNTDDLMIGDAPSSSNFNGLIEEMRIWGTERTENHIRSNMYNEIGGSATGLIAYYRFNESGGSITDNEQGLSDLDGTLINMAGSAWISSTVPMPFRTQSGASNWSSSSSWANGTIPNSSWAPVEIYHNIIVDDDYEASSLRVFGATVTISPTGSLKLSGNLINSGTLQIQSNSSGNIGSFIDNGTILGTMKLQRFISQNKWHYVSIPISTADASTFRGAALYTYSEPTGAWSPISSGSLSRMVGYDVYFPNTGNKTIIFNGTFNTGSISLGLTYNSLQGQGYNLVGNPYPSTIDWDAPSGWTRTNVNSAIYIWNPSTAKAETYVLGGGTGVDGGSRYIPPTQGFFVICTANTTLGMNNNIRATTNRELRENYTTNEIRLKITGRNNSSESLIRFNQEATERFDGEFDAYKFFSLIPSDPQIYTTNEENIQFSINSIPSSTSIRSIPLHAYIGEDFGYALDWDLSKLDEQMDLYLEDLFTSEVVNMRELSHYEFDAKKSDNRERFIIHLVPFGELYNKTNSLVTDEQNESLVYSSAKDIYVIPSENTTKASVQVYNLFGKEIVNTQINTAGLAKVASALKSGVYIVRLQSENSYQTTKVSIP
jgi:hypothetical protein